MGSLVDSSESEMEDNTEEIISTERRSTRDKRDQYAKIRATLRDDSLSDEEPLSERIPYRKKGWKAQKKETPPISISPVEDAILSRSSPKDKDETVVKEVKEKHKLKRKGGKKKSMK